MNYILKIFTLILLCTTLNQASYLILNSDKSKNIIQIELGIYHKMMRENKVLQLLKNKEKFKANITQIENQYILRVGPIENGNTMALMYLKMHEVFPKTFILDEIIKKHTTKPLIKYVEKEVVKEVVKEDEALWRAIFGLAIVGILALFLSSDQLKNLKIRHNKLQEKQSEIEKKQSLLLSKMGEKIQIAALQNVDNEKKILETTLEECDTEQIRTHIDTMKKQDEDLLRTTYEMIDFLKIKSGNIQIKQEAFQLSNMLHKLTNAVAPILQRKNHTLIYDIDKNVTRYLVGDTDRVYQVLYNLLLDILYYKENSEIILKIEIIKEEKLIFKIINKDQYLTEEEIDTLFIPTSWEDLQKTHREFGFFVLNELIDNMNGTFLINSVKKKGTTYELSLPYLVDRENRSNQYELKKILSHKKALVIDSEIKKSNILIGYLEAFNINVSFESIENVSRVKPDLNGINFIIINVENISQRILGFLEDISNKNMIDIIAIKNIYGVPIDAKISYIMDAELLSPLIFGDIEEVLKQLCIKKEKRKNHILKERLSKFKIIQMPKVLRSDFQKFKSKKILLVEDNIVSQQVISSILSVSKLEVYKVENGIEALEFLEKVDAIDLIIMDMNMPMMDGFMTTQRIRNDTKYKDVPIIAITGLGFTNELEKMIHAGVNACIVKPFKVGQLYIALERFLESQTIVNSENKNIVEPFIENRSILDVSKGIEYVRSKKFYKEIVLEVKEALRNSDRLVRKMIEDNHIEELKVFCIDAVGLCATIGATDFVLCLHTMLHDIVENREEEIDDYASLYTKEWLKLEKEIMRYIKH